MNWDKSGGYAEEAARSVLYKTSIEVRKVSNAAKKLIKQLVFDCVGARLRYPQKHATACKTTMTVPDS